MLAAMGGEPLEMTSNYLLHIGKLRQGVSIINGGNVSMSGTHQEHATLTLHIGHPTGNQTPGGQAPAPVLTEGSRVDQSPGWFSFRCSGWTGGSS